jgi:hypothetical protein
MDGLVEAGFIVLGGPLADEHRVVHVVEAESEDAVRATLARDPWSQTHLHVDAIDPWTIRLDGRRLAKTAHTRPAHMFREAASIGRAREYVNSQLANLTAFRVAAGERTALSRRDRGFGVGFRR